MTARCFFVPWFVAAGPMLAGAAAAAITAWPAAALAYRPFDTTDAAVSEKGEVEPEVGPLHWLRAEGETLLIAPALVANFGVVERWELVLEGKHVRRLNTGTTEGRSALVDTALPPRGCCAREACKAAGAQASPPSSACCCLSRIPGRTSAAPWPSSARSAGRPSPSTSTAFCRSSETVTSALLAA
jgi:hypothetical protein